MSAAPPVFPLHVGDYLTDTGHLTIEQSGAYLHLLMYGWRSGRIPDDEADLARLCRVTTRYWRAKIAPALLPFFDRETGLLISRRLEAERSKAIESVEQQRAKAKARWDAEAARKVEKTRTFPTPMCSSNDGVPTKENNNLADAKAMPTLYPSPLTLVQERKIGPKPAPNDPSLKPARRARAVRPPLPVPAWVPPQPWEDYVANRAKLRRPLTEGAVRLIVEKLDKFRQRGIDIALALNNSTENGWQGVFEPRGTPAPTGIVTPFRPKPIAVSV